MSNGHYAEALELTIGSPGAKSVLLVLADRACGTCGLCWPGVNKIAEWTEMGPTSIRKALDTLRERGLIIASGYETGGRGRTTEYVVLPHLPGLSTAPCVECVKRRKKPIV